MLVPQLKPDSTSGSQTAIVNRSAVRTAWIAGCFCLLLSAAMIIQHVWTKLDDPLKAPQMAALKDQLMASPKDEALKQQIREQDLVLRHHYFQHLTFNEVGGWMLLAGLLVFLVAAGKAVNLRRQLPRPRIKPNLEEHLAQNADRARWSVSTIGLIALLGLVVMGLAFGSIVPSDPADIEALFTPSEGAANPARQPGPSPAEYQSNWPRFRGPGGNGIANHTNVLLNWDVATGEGVLWKSEVPSAGFNSPVIWGARIFMSGGGKEKREVMCFDLLSGKLLWQNVVENVPGNSGELPEIPEMTGFAAPSMATDGRHAYVIFANGDLAAYTFDGQQAWAKHLGVPLNPHGHATSLTTWQDRLLVQLDQGAEDERLSKLYAFDGATGNIIWQRQRPVGDSWASPIVIEAAGKTQIITLGLPWLMAHEVKEGTELWRANVLEGEVTPSPVFANGALYVVNPNIYLMAVRPNGQGDVTESHLLWKAEDGIPDITSPVCTGELVFLVSTYGVVTCYDAKDGKHLWEHDYEMDFNASPTLVGGRLLLVSLSGLVITIEAAREFKELARVEMGEKIFATPAFAQDRMVLRTEKSLFCIGAGEKTTVTNE